jgi:hypothetical protein
MNTDLKDQLTGLGLTEDQIEKLGTSGVKEVSDIEMLNAEEIVTITGCGLVIAKKITKAFTAKVEVSAGPTNMAYAMEVLPAIPTDELWLNALRIGGVLKVDESTVIAAIRAALANKVGLYSVPDKLAKKMEEFADENAESIPAEFFKIRKQLTRRNYADIFEAIEGLDGTFVTETRKKSFLSKVDQNLWPEIIAFYSQLKNWSDTWQQSSASPAMFMNAISAMINGGGKMVPGMMPPPDTGILRDGADALNDSINKVFAGVGVQISSALAYEATKIKETLENSKLPALIGAANREQMLRSLGVEVPATYPRLEMSLTRFVMGVIKIKDIPAGEEELQYFSALLMLGSQIPWDKFDGSGSGLGKRGQL